MNKKFSTLVAGLLLATSVGTANAQGAVSAFTGAELATSIAENRYYQLVSSASAASGTSLVLGMFETAPNSGQYELKYVLMDGAALSNTLWKVSVLTNAEGGISQTLVNVGTGLTLSMDAAKAYVNKAAAVTPLIASSQIGGSTSVWKWQPSVKAPAAGYAVQSLTSAFHKDSVLTLEAVATVADGVRVAAIKHATNETPTLTNAVTLVPFNAAPVVLMADDLNSMLWSQNPALPASKMQLSFNKDVMGSTIGNLFTAAYKAEAAVGYPANAPLYTTPGAAATVTVADLAAYEKTQQASAVAKAIQTIFGATDAAVLANAPKVLVAAKDLAGITTVGVTSAAEVNALLDAQAFTTDVTDEDKALNRAVRNVVKTYVVARGFEITDKASADAVLAEVVSTTITGTVNVLAATTTINLATAATAVKVVTDLEAPALLLANTEKTTGLTALKNAGWVSLKLDDKKYLRVDTSFITNNAGAKQLAFKNDKEFADLTANSAGAYLVSDNETRLDINGRYNFQFTYYPTQDSIVIRTGGYAQKSETDSYWKDMAAGAWDAAATDVNSTTQYNEEMNLVKIAVLTDTHREVTVGSSEYRPAFTPKHSVNTKISLNSTKMDNRTTLASGLYFLNLQTELASRKAENNGFKIAKLTANLYTTSKVKYAVEEESQKFNTVQNYGYMPAAQWVVEKIVGGEAGKERVNIYNREYPSIKLENVQLYTDGKGNIALPYTPAANIFATADTLKFTEVKTVKPAVTKAYTDTYLGYWQIDSTMLAEKMFKLDYLSGIQLGNYVNVLDSETDSIIRVDLKGAHTMFAIETAPVKAEGFFGYDGNLVKGTNRLFPQLRRTAYVLKVRDANKLEHNNKYVKSITTTSTGEPLYVVATIAKDKAQTFFFKENNRVVLENEDKVTETPYFAFVETAVPTHLLTDTLYTEYVNRIGVKDASLLLSREEYKETRVAAFAFADNDTPLYRRFDTELESKEAKDQPVTLKFFRANNPKEFLYENATKGTTAPSNAYGVKGISFLGMINEAQFAEKDDRSYSIYVDTAYVRNETIMPQYLLAVRPEVIKADTIWCGENHKDEADSLGCIHTKVYPSFTRAQYLINAQDSVDTAKNGRSYLFQDYTRLAFVDAAHYNDTLYILRGANAGIATADINFTKIPVADKVALYKNAVGGHNNVKFSFRLIDDSKKFLIESKGDRIIPTGTTGGWVKYHNGVPVIAQNMTFAEAIRQAEIFDVTKDTKFAPTDNEAIGTTEVSVIAGEGQVVINNAAGKTVVVSNILGQTIAQTVLTSDNATISVPAGIVVVSVDGEAAVKAIVK